MRLHVLVALLMAIALGIAGVQEANAAAVDPEGAKAFSDAMNPGKGQKRLEYMVGTFDVQMRTWIDASAPPSESSAVAIGKWVLGGRYVQVMLSGFVAGEPFDAIGYAGYDNVSQEYKASYMDSASTGMEWFTGQIASDGQSALMTATTHDEITKEPVALEMRLTMTADGNRVTQFWQADESGEMMKVLELVYTRKSP